MKKIIVALLLIGVAFIINTASVFALEDPFSDTSPSLLDPVTYLADRGIIEGYPDGTIRLDNDINRAEVTKILVEGNGVTPDPTKYKDCFTDVNEQWYAPYICYAFEQEWVQGYADGTFKPAQTILRSEVIKLILISQDYEIPNDAGFLPYTDFATTEWFAVYVKAASDRNLIPEIGPHLNPSDEMKRRGAFEILFRALVIEELGIDEYYKPYTDSIFGRGAVQNVEGNEFANNIKITWDAFEGHDDWDSYIVYMKEGSNFEPGDIEVGINPVAVMPGETSFTFTNLENGTYYFIVGTAYLDTRSNFSQTIKQSITYDK